MIDVKYRPDIDGLRAVAVALVLLFHADLRFSGGYIGVDVFFVISGYLITGLILKEKQAGRFTLTGFWTRRIRRILPASMLVTAATLVGGAILLMPSYYKELAEASIAQQLMSSNIYFWQESGYFGGTAKSKALLHTWSLAVEEQFYLFYPFLLIFLHRFSRTIMICCLIAIATVSLAFCIWTTTTHSSAAFYLLPARAWELLLGAIVCIVPLPKLNRSWQINLISLIGFTSILAASYWFDDSTSFPGYHAVIPCLGAALIIYSSMTQLSLVGKFLATPPMVAIGLLSYSIYLWHWPLLVFAHYWYIDWVPGSIRLSILFLSVALAYLSWRFVEIPFRNKKYQVSTRNVFLAAILTSLILIGVSICIILTKGARFRYAPEVLLFDTRWDGIINPQYEGTIEDAEQGQLPRIGEEYDLNSQVDYMVWGDSHARAVGKLVDDLGKEYGLSSIIAARSKTGPLLNSTVRPADQIEWNNRVLENVRGLKIQNVILVGRWTTYFGAGIPKDNAAANVEGINNTVNELRAMGVRVWILNQVPEQSRNPNILLMRASLNGMPLPTGITRNEDQDKRGKINSILDSMSNDNVTLLNPLPYCFNRQNESRLGDSGGSYYWDDDHLSVYGTHVLLRDLFKPVFQDIANHSVHGKK